MSPSNISGTPTTAGTSAVTVTVTDSAGSTASQVFNLVVTAAATSPVLGAIVTQTLTVGALYTLTLSATAGTPPYTFSTTALPAGLALSGAVISGTPTTAGTTSVTITVTDSLNKTGTAVISFVVQASVPILVFAALPSETLTVGTAFSLSLASYASGGTTPYSFTSTTLPAGLTLNAGVISGTPTTAATVVTVTITLTDSTTPNHQTTNRTMSITVKAAATGSVPAMPGVTAGSTRVFANGQLSGSALNAGANFPTATTVLTANGQTGNFVSAYPYLSTGGEGYEDIPNGDTNNGTTNWFSMENVNYCAPPSGGGPGNSLYYRMYYGSGKNGSGIYYTAAPIPTNADGSYAGPASGGGFLYGRWGGCIKLVTANSPPPTGYLIAYLLWTSANIWIEGEIDYPNSIPGDMSGTWGGASYLGNCQFEQTPYAPAPLTDGKYHTFYCDWPNSSEISCYLDGSLLGTLTEGIPSVPMRVSLQIEEGLNTGVPPQSSVILFELAWLYIDVY
jgi:hypothetical protein